MFGRVLEYSRARVRAESVGADVRAAAVVGRALVRVGARASCSEGKAYK